MASGYPDKFIFECPVLRAADLFQRLYGGRPPGKVRLREPDESHLTLLFLGDARALALEISAGGTATADHVCDELRKLAAWILRRGDKATTAQIQRSAVINKSYLVLVVEPDDQLQALRDEAWEALLRLLVSAGIEDPMGFLMASRSVRLPSATWLPHITLAKDYHGPVPVLGATGLIELGPVRLHR